MREHRKVHRKGTLNHLTIHISDDNFFTIEVVSTLVEEK